MHYRAILVSTPRQGRWLRRYCLATACAGLIVSARIQATAQTAPPPAEVSPLTRQAPGSVGELAAQFDKSPEIVVATVDDSPITAGMVSDRIRDFPDKYAVLPAPLVYKAAVSDLIEQRSLAVKAKALGLEKTPEAQRRIVEATDRVLAQMLYWRILPELVTTKAIEARYNATVAGQPGPTEVRFRVIGAESEADAKIVLDVLSRGTDFGSLAQQVSKDPSGSNAGEIGFTTRDRLAPEIAAVAFSLLPGQMTMFPVPSHGLWFIIQVEERRQRGTPTLADSQAQLTGALVREASAEILEKTRASVVVKDLGPTGRTGHEAEASGKTR